ncbi:unnamed protein product [Rotaria sordida]|uniref:Hexosyltransferase n=1 Tax=Rotaria sordida TaxID=392033 RepID=A0A819TBE7_9BILA|nr:unnamed protein product [Rotaria sordida]
MPSSIKLVNHSFIFKYKSLNKLFGSCQCHLSVYMKCIICILILYYLNILIGFNSSIWSEKSFENEYYLRMIHIDVTKIEENVEQVLGLPINILPNKFLIKNEYLCGRSLDPETLIHPHLIILVKSNCENFQERQAIRMTWAQKNRLLKTNIQLAFVLGTNPHNTSVEDESAKYGDIIQIDKIDYYYYSSYKMIMMLRWINDYCTSKSRRSPHIDLRKYVLFVDDDYYVDLDSLLLYIYSIDEDKEMTTYERRTFLTGELIEKSRPRRFINDRWYVSINDYPYDMYPNYISTGCFLMTRYNARLYYIASKYIRLFYFDHVYMGLLSYSMSTNLIANNQLFSTSLSLNRKLNNNQLRFLYQWKSIFNNQIYFNSTKNPICFRGYRTQKLIDIWNQIHQTNLTFTFDSSIK